MPQSVARERLRRYLGIWKRRDYQEGIPDTVPDELMRERLAPSYRAIVIAILSNDLQFHSLGFQPPRSPWYNHLKRVEIQAREGRDDEPARPTTGSQLTFVF